MELCSSLNQGFFEEQSLPKSFETFLNECKYLEECRIYKQRGINFQKTVHGKTLTEHLFSNCKTFIKIKI